MIITTEIVKQMILYAAMILTAIFILWGFIVAMRSGELQDMFLGTWKAPWEKEEKKRAKKEAKERAKAAKKNRWVY